MNPHRSGVETSHSQREWEVPDDFIAAVFGWERKQPGTANTEHPAVVECRGACILAGGSQ